MNPRWTLGWVSHGGEACSPETGSMADEHQGHLPCSESSHDQRSMSVCYVSRPVLDLESRDERHSPCPQGASSLTGEMRRELQDYNKGK